MQQRERRTLSVPSIVPSIAYEDVDQQQDLEMTQRQQQQQQQHGFLGTPPPNQALGGGGVGAGGGGLGVGVGVGAGAAGGGAAGGAGGGAGVAPGATSGWPPHPPQTQALGHGQMATLAKPTAHMARSRSASTSSLSAPTGPTPSPQKKKIVTACQRCRTRKIRCDGALPACRSCVKAGVECIEVDRTGDHNMPRSHVLELENRIKWLEEIVRSRCPDVALSAGPPVELRSRPAPPAIRIVTTGPDFNQPQPLSSASSPVFPHSPASTCATPVSFDFSSPGVSPGYLQPMSPFTFSDVGPSPAASPGPSSPLLLAQDTLPHEVGLLSLAASEEPKYLGASSGVNFARMVFADAKDTDLLHSGNDVMQDAKQHIPSSAAEPAQLPPLDHCMALKKAYFETVHLQYPFLHQPTFDGYVQAVYHRDTQRLPGSSFTTAQLQMFLVMSIGAHILSTRAQGQDLNSEGYYAAALRLADDVSLTGSLLGAQISLLLAMRSLYATGGWNVWYLNAIIMATCIDLGLQRKCQPIGGDQSTVAMKRRVFWCAYALDRNLGIALGRPCSIRDECFDVELPVDTDNDDELPHGPAIPQSTNASRATFSNSISILRITKLMSSIKTILYRIAPPASSLSLDLPDWQMKIYQQLHELQEQVRSSRGGVRRNSGSSPQATVGQLVELKIHEAIQLLFRPSPVFRRPTAQCLRLCFDSAIETIRIYNLPKRYKEPPYPYTRLTEHSVFLSGLTMLYCHRHCPEVRQLASNEVLAEDIRSCSNLLADLAQLWPTAQKSKAKFDAVAQSTLAFSSAVASSRMLSPHDGARRASGSSIRSFAESQTLEVPSVPTLGSSPSSHTTVSAWYGTPDVGIPSGTQDAADLGWSIPWEDMSISQEDIMISGMEAMPTEMESIGMLADLMGEDTTMWGMDDPPPQQHPPPR